MSHPLLLTGFSDEAAIEKTVDQQFAAFSALGLRYLSLRFIDVGGGVKNVMQLDEQEIGRVKQKLDDYGLSVSSIGSPIGKVKLLDVEDGTSNQYFPFEEYLDDQVQRACDLANQFDSKLIRGFSFYHPKGTRPEDHVAEATDRLGRIAEKCTSNGVVFGLEVEANLVGQNGQILAQIHEAIGSESLVLIFDGGNLVTQGFDEDEIFDQYRVMKPGLGWIHIKDFRRPAGFVKTDHVDEEALKHFVPAELGNSGHLRILEDLREELPRLQQKMQNLGVAGVFADMEPHVRGGGQFGGYSGPDGFGVALRSFCRLCDQAGISYSLRTFDEILESRTH